MNYPTFVEKIIIMLFMIPHLLAPLIVMGIALLLMGLISLDKTGAPTPTQIVPYTYPGRKKRKPIDYGNRWKKASLEELTNTGIKWWVVERALDTISPAEQLIADQLSLYDVRWFREVTFEGLLNSNNQYMRFDFYLSDINLIIEYDSVQWHSTYESQVADTIKDTFCDTYKIRIRRLDKSHYYLMADTIEKMMTYSSVYKKKVAG